MIVILPEHWTYVEYNPIRWFLCETHILYIFCLCFHFFSVQFLWHLGSDRAINKFHVQPSLSAIKLLIGNECNYIYFMRGCVCVVNICLSYCPDLPVWTTTRRGVRNGDPKSGHPRPILVAACPAVREPTTVNHQRGGLQRLSQTRSSLFLGYFAASSEPTKVNH